MSMIIKIFLAFPCAILLVACATNTFREPPEVALGANFSMECLVHFDTIHNFRADGGKCRKLRECIQKKSHKTILRTYDAYPIYEKLEPFPFKQGKYVSISYMRTRANELGPDAQAMFDLIYDID